MSWISLVGSIPALVVVAVLVVLLVLVAALEPVVDVVGVPWLARKAASLVGEKVALFQMA